MFTRASVRFRLRASTDALFVFLNEPIRHILTELGHYKLTELNKENFLDFYDTMCLEKNTNTGDALLRRNFP